MIFSPRAPDDDPVIVKSWIAISEPESATATDPIRQALSQWLEITDLKDARYFLEKHPELLHEETLTLLQEDIDAAKASGDELRAASFRNPYYLLRKSLDLGISYAFDEFAAEQRHATPAELHEVVLEAVKVRRRVQKAPDLEAMNSAVDAWQRVLDAPAIEKYPDFREDVRLELAGALKDRGAFTGNVDDIKAAVAASQKVLDAVAADSDLHKTAQYSLSNCFRDLFD